MTRTKQDAVCSSSHNHSEPAITLLIAVLAATLLFLSLMSSGHVAAQTGDTPTPEPTPEQPDDFGDQHLPPIEDKLNPPQYTKMDSNLNRIVEQVQTGQFTAQAAAANAPVRSGASVAVTFYITEGYADVIAAYLTDNGASPRNIGIDYIEAYVPVSLLAEASLQEGVIRIRTIVPPQPAQGVVVSEGFWVHGVSSWRRAGYRGEGVKIGIIDAGFGDFESLMGTELPSTVQARCYIEVGVFTSDLADCETGSHGTAVTEAVFDIAPEATYYISNALASGDLAKTAVDWMVEEGVDIINMSLGFVWDGRGDGTFYSSNSPLRSVDIAVVNGTTWANAAGNDALGTWFGSFTDSNGNGFHEFSGTDECNEIQDGGYRFQLRWDDQWGGATIDLDLYLYDLDNDVHIGPLISSNDVQSGAVGDIPYETLEEVYGYGTYCLAVKHHGGDIPDWIQLTGWHAELEHHTLFGSIGNPAESASPGMLAVGAAPSHDIFTIEHFSSRGPTTDGRVKPDIVGADESDSAVWGHWSGTSQASPHIAGLAALVKQRFPDYSPAQVADYLKEHAEERGVPGPDNTWGYGFARLPALDEAPTVSTDRAPLVAFYNATNGDDWTNNTNWLTDAHIYGWYGVTVNVDGSVTRLTLEENNLAGEMPAELGDLSGLESLNLWNNQLTGEIPTELSNLTRLRTLDIGRNQLTGPIPADLGSLSNLEELWLDRNQLTGEIPAELSNLINLTVLNIAENQIEGEIPAWLGDLSDLEELFLADNQLTGCIPEGLRDIPDNDFDELGLPFCDDVQVPTDPCVEQLTGDGTVDGSWEMGSECVSENRDGDGTGAYARYYTFTLTEESELTVTLESTVDTYLYLLEGVGRDGKQVAENDDAAGGDNYNSRIEETLGPGDYTIEATTYESGASGTFTLTIEGLGDSVIPPTPSSDREVLVALYNATDGPEWNDNDNWLSRVDIGEWLGVTTDEYGRVTHLKLSSNELEGDIPPLLGNLSSLTELNLFDNELTGDIPPELSNLTQLRTLDIGWNQLKGEIPAELGSLPDLEELWLDRNQLTGEIPAELSNLTDLTVLNIAENQIEGEIPAWLGDLSDLEELFLADNQLTGCIPEGLRDIPDNDFDKLGLPFCDDVQVPTDPCVEQLTGDGTVDGSWEMGSECVSENRDGDGTGAYARYYTFTLTEESELTVTLESTVDTYLYLLEGVGRDGKQVAENDDIDREGGDYNSLIEGTFEPGDYTIEATTYEAEATGDFILTVAGIDFAEQRDRAGLVAFYNATNGDNWRRNDNWLTDAPLDDWYGVETDNHGRVIELRLEDNNLTGSIPPELGNLSNLKGLLLNFNGLTGVIPPELSRPNHIVYLDLAGNQLTGTIPPELRDATFLRVLDLRHNELTGAIPPELAKLEDLRTLSLHDNQLTGAIPSELARLDNLENLLLQRNQLTGQIPPELADLSNLKELHLGTNQLTGQIPPELSNLTNLESLTLGRNQLTGNIPPELSDLPNLVALWLYDNQLTGQIPPSLGNLDNAIVLDFTDNRLTGPIPTELSNLTRLEELSLGGNRLTGQIPTWLGNLEHLEELYLHDNQLTGVIPPELGGLPELEELSLSGNQLTGCVPVSLEEALEDFDELDLPFCENPDRAALVALYHATGGDRWEENHNWLTDAPLSEWYGVTTNADERVTDLELVGNNLTGQLTPELSHLSELRTLNFYNNHLTGTIPIELDNLNSLTHLIISVNELTGTIPSELANNDNLTILDLWDNQLTGTIPSELSNLNSLTILFLGGNHLTGTIPSELGNLTSLTHLSLRSNRLSGAIPPELANINSLAILDLLDNQLTGTIPIELSKLTSLTRLSLGGNQFTGEIPSEFANLINLQYLELANNNLTGEIPPELSALTELHELHLSGNQLTGCIPDTLGDVEDNDLYELNLPFCSGRTSAFDECARAFSRLPYESSGIGTENMWSRLCESVNRPGSYARFYTLTLHHPFNVSVALTSEQDTYLYLMGGIGADGIVLHQNDDYEGTNSRIQAPLHPGNYTIEATTHDAGATGAFYLEVDVDDWDPIPPPTALTDRAALTALYHSANGDDWQASDNWLTDAPLSDWHGVEADDDGRVIRLDLEASNLSGELPLEFGNLDQLEWVNISHNQLTGELSRSLTNLAMLEYFYFDNNAGLCAPVYDAFQEWAQSLEDFRGDACAPSLPNPERDALIKLYYATGGDDWRINVGWLTGAPLGDWQGVTTDGDGRVVELDLYSNNLYGHIPSELGNLTDLTELRLDNNQLSGEIPPELGSLTNLTFLGIDGNDLSGEIPPELANLTGLEGLYLGFNRLSGEIPAELGNLTGLESLYLWDNNLSGEIPAELGDITTLKHLILDRNELTGEIPAAFGNLTNLEELRINDNQFTGHIPVELGNLAELRTLDLSHNQLTGGIPPELGNLTNLIEIDINTNHIGGQIPPKMGTLSNLERINFADNDLTGEVPAALADIETLTQLYLWDNDLTAQDFLVRLSEMTTLERLSLSGNQIDGADVLPQVAALPNLIYLGLRDSRLTTDELLPYLDSLNGLEYLILSDNLLTGDRLLPMFAEFDDLIYLDVSRNQLTGGIPPAFGNHTRLRGLLLSENLLTGEVPPELGNFRILTYLHLNDNLLTGSLPRNLIELGWMAEFYFENNNGLCAPADAAFQEWLQAVENVQGDTCGAPSENPDRSALVALYHATDGDDWRHSDNWLTDAPLSEWYGVATNTDGRVTELELTYNDMHGEIPPDIAKLANLKTLDLGGNELTGNIPPWLGDLAHLETLDLGANAFSGNIPPELANLRNLHYLWLGFNDLEGDIPSEIANLSNLELLHLGSNDLSGEIPPELGSITNLTSLDLGYNELTGMIPSELGELASLEELRLGDNSLSGAIPSELAALANLKELSLPYNELAGDVPPWIANLGNLEALVLLDNNLTGEIPAGLGSLAKLKGLGLGDNNLTGEVPSELGNLTELKGLGLEYNYLTGKIPEELGNLTKLENGLDLSGNNLVGEVPPELGNLTELRELHMSNNLLTGTLPHSLTAMVWLMEFSFDHNAGLCAPADDSFQNWLQDIDDQEGNTCGVPSPPSDERDITALTALYSATNGDDWKRNRNWLSDAPVSEWYGVTTDADGRVLRLDLYDNNLSGTIPSELANLSILTSLSLSENELTGEFPPELTELTNLTLLYFDNNAGLCAPADAAFQDWLQAMINVSGPTCDAPPPYPERTWAINRSLTIGDFTMRLHQITDTADELRVEYSYETDLSELDYLPNDNATIRYPDGTIHDTYMARLPEEGEDIDVSLGGFTVFDAYLNEGSVDIPLASVSDDGALDPQPELLAGDERYGITELIYFEENEQLTIMIRPLNEAAKYRVLGIGSGLDESTEVTLTDDFGITSEWVSGSSAFDPFEQTLDYQTFDFLAVSPERFASVTKFTLTVRGGGNIVGPFVFEDLRLAPEDAMPKPPAGQGEDTDN